MERFKKVFKRDSKTDTLNNDRAVGKNKSFWSRTKIDKPKPGAVQMSNALTASTLTPGTHTRASESTPNLETGASPEAAFDVSKNLWQAAVEKLDEKSKSTLHLQFEKLENPAPLRIIDSLELSLQQITQQREEHGQKSWKCRDKTTQMLKSVMTFKGFIDAGLKFDPTGYGTIAWTVVSSGLQMWINDQAQQECILEGSVYLSNLISYYARVEKFYITRPSQAVAFLQAKITEVYVAILKYSVELRAIIDQGNITRLVSSLNPGTEGPLLKLKSSCEKEHNAVERLQNDVNNENMRLHLGDITKNMEQNAKQTEESIQHILQYFEGEHISYTPRSHH